MFPVNFTYMQSTQYKNINKWTKLLKQSLLNRHGDQIVSNSGFLRAKIL